jgi:hypothetical protein
MTTSAKRAEKGKAKRPSDYSYVGTTGDGVKIIRPKLKATHFTSKEIRKAILDVKRASAAKK